MRMDQGKQNKSSCARNALRGALRGLNPNNILPPPSTQRTIELFDNDQDASHESVKENRHGTRASRNGLAPVLYDMKYVLAMFSIQNLLTSR